VCGVWFDIAFQVENQYNVTPAQLTNDSTVNETIGKLAIFDSTQGEIINASQHAPGNPLGASQDPSSSTTSISQSSWSTGILFAQKLFILPGVILGALNDILPVDPRFMNALIIIFAVVITFILISAVFFNRL
jgi:hypothetical protein